MSIQETLLKCNTFVIQKENEYGQSLLHEYDENTGDETLLDRITKECRRLDDKDAYDEEEVTIALIVKRRGII